MTDFCHISPTHYLPTFAENRSHHLVLAHLVETDARYTEFYSELATSSNSVVIMDNSAFEMYKAGLPMYPTSQLLEMAVAVKADYIVMSDYPGEPKEKTIQAAVDTAPKIHEAGFGTFFVPQAEVGDLESLFESFEWASTAPEVDYIGISILAIPNGYGVEKGNNLQRFLSRWWFMKELERRGILDTIVANDKKIHFLGMVDGPNEVALVGEYLDRIDTWDSSAACWLGLNGMVFDRTPTGRLEGKFEKEVDFNHASATTVKIAMAKVNCKYIDDMIDDLTT
jgi:hypothetical protein